MDDKQHISREALTRVRADLEVFPAVAILGPRQVGKTTLAQACRGEATGPVTYLDLELPSDLAQLSDREAWLAAHSDRLVIIDEVQRAPDLFVVLRPTIDRQRRQGRHAGSFLLLGSAGGELLRQSAESLAGRIAFVELPPVGAAEAAGAGIGDHELWVRGGFPRSLLASSDRASFAWRGQFLRTFLERDVPQFGSRVPATTLRRFWTMLAHEQAQPLNAARLAGALDVSAQSVTRYVDLLVDLLLVRRLAPWSSNVGKRLVKSPRVIIRDSGLVHALLGLVSLEDVLAHPVAGASWEGFVIENLINAAPPDAFHFFYRTVRGAEIDLILEMPGVGRWAIEVKRSSAPTLGRGFHLGIDDVAADRAWVVHGGDHTYPMPGGVTAIGLRAMIDELRAVHDSKAT